MDFFEYASVAHMFVNTKTWYVPYIVGGICFLIVFLFQAVGLFVIAGREGYKNRWMAFIPFFNTYYIGVCGQKNRVFKSVDTRIFSLVAAILEVVLVAGYIVNYVAHALLVSYNLIEYVDTVNGYGLSWAVETLSSEISAYPELAWAAWCYEILDKFILHALNLAFLVMQIFTLTPFFQTFAARRYLLFTISSVLFPIQGILIFILRNNKGMNYREYMRKEQERQYRMYQQYRQQQSFDKNPYNQNPYSKNPYEGEYGGSSYNNSQNYSGGAGGNSASNKPDDPFSEFGNGGNNNDPFQN